VPRNFDKVWRTLEDDDAKPQVKLTAKSTIPD
jgi:hypothetical protein